MKAWQLYYQEMKGVQDVPGLEGKSGFEKARFFKTQYDTLPQADQTVYEQKAVALAEASAAAQAAQAAQVSKESSSGEASGEGTAEVSTEVPMPTAERVLLLKLFLLLFG